MEFGVVAGPALPSAQELDSHEAFGYVMEMCQVAHDSGFDALGCSHRMLSGPEVQFFQPFPLAAHLMARFPEMYVMTNVFLLPYDHPVEIAEQVATLDMMSPGKFLFGVGQAYRENETYAWAMPDGKVRARRLAESIRAMRLLWTEQAPDFEGEFWSFKSADIGARPGNGHGPPILIAADRERTVALVPERGGDHWLPSARHSKIFLRKVMPVYRQALEAQGREFTGLPVIRDICVADSRAEAADIISESITRYLHMQHRHGQPGEAYNLDFDQLAHERMILGTPEEATRELIELHEEFGAEFVMFRVYTPGMDRQRALETIRRLGTEVFPEVRRAVGNGSLFG